MAIAFPSMGRAGASCPLLFTPAELRAVLSAYSHGVINKGWRDYAIQGFAAQSVFSVLEGASGRVLFSLSKNKSAKTGGAPYYRVFEGDTQLIRTESFAQAVDALQKAGKSRR